MTGPRVAVIGGGISGLAAAHRLRTLAGSDCMIEVFEASERLGGKLRTVSLAGVPVDVGAEAFLVRRPEVPDLLAELGLAGDIMHPSGRASSLRVDGALHPIPKGTLMGVPADPAALTGILGDAAFEAERLDSVPLRWDGARDTTVGGLVAARFGPEVVRRCVDPLLGGVYSGSADSIGLRTALPVLAEALDAGARTLRDAVVTALPAPVPGPVFGALSGGYGRLVDALAEAGRARIHMRAEASRVRPRGSGWEVEVRGPEGGAETGTGGAYRAEESEAGPYGAAEFDARLFDAVILALPAPQTAELLRGVAPAGAEQASRIDLADSAVVALAVPRSARLPDKSGVLVATGERGVSAKACTLTSRKWPHLDPDHTGCGVQVLRLSYGRYGDAAVIGESDAELTARARADLRALLDVDTEPVDAHVQRWRGGLPQYGPGHGDLVAAVEAAVADVPGLAIAGSAWHGVGVPACIAGGRAAAASVVADITG